MAELFDSTAGQHLEAIKADLIALDLEEVGANWHIRKMPWLVMNGEETERTPVGIICNIARRRQREGMIGLNDWRYRALVAIIRAGNRDLEENYGTSLLWQELMENRYANSTVLRAYDVTGLMGSDIEPGVPQDAQGMIKGYDALYFVIQSRVRLHPTALP